MLDQSQGTYMFDPTLHAAANAQTHTENELRERIAELERQLALYERMASPCGRQAFDLLAILDAIPIPIFFKDVEGVYQGCNTAYEAYLARPRSQIIGKTLAEVEPDDLAEYYHEADLELMQQRISQTYE